MNWMVPTNTMLLYVLKRTAELLVWISLGIDVKISFWGPYDLAWPMMLIVLSFVAMTWFIDQLLCVSDTHHG